MKIESIERQIRELSAEEFSAFRVWFHQYEAEIWDNQLNDDVWAGKLEALAERAIEAHKDGRSTPL